MLAEMMQRTVFLMGKLSCWTRRLEILDQSRALRPRACSLVDFKWNGTVPEHGTLRTNDHLQGGYQQHVA